MVDRYYRDHDPRDEEWWARPDPERTCACCGEVFICDERLERLPHVFCPECTDRVVEAVHETKPGTTTR